jgi:hypothetical protein
MKLVTLVVFIAALVMFTALACVSVPIVIPVGEAHTCPSGTHWGSQTTTYYPTGQPVERTYFGCVSNETNELVQVNRGSTFYIELVGITLGVDLSIVFALALILLVIIAILRRRQKPGAGSTSAFGSTAA